MSAPSWQSLVVETRATPGRDGALTCQLPDEWFGVVTPLRGSCRIEDTDGRERRYTTIVPGEICLIAPSKSVRVRRAPPEKLPFELGCVRVPTDTLRCAMSTHPTTAARDLSALHALRAFDPHIASMVPALLRARDAGIADHYAASAARYLAAYLVHPQRAALPGPGVLDADQLRAVRAYLTENLASRITLDQLAGKAGLSRYHFLRRFSASTGTTPMRYLAELRFDTARHRLATSDEPIAQVGRKCGFPSAGTFARAFRKHVGCSPSQYRQRSRPA